MQILAAILYAAFHPAFGPGISIAPASQVSVKAIQSDIPSSKIVDISKEPCLFDPVSLQINGRPLREALVSLASQKAGASDSLHLLATSAVAEQRVTICATEQPLYRVMQRIAQLLSHSSAEPCYIWVRESRPGLRGVCYLLKQTKTAQKVEQQALDFPRKQGILLLREQRQLLRARPDQIPEIHKEMPDIWVQNKRADDPSNVALRTLTDDAFERLCQGEVIKTETLPENGFTTRALRLSTGEQNDSSPWMWGWIGLTVIETAPDGRYHLGAVYNAPYQSRSLNPPPDNASQTPNPSGNPVEPIDLAPFLKGEKNVTTDLSVVLKALAKATKANFYHEHFYGVSGSPAPLPQENATYGWWRGDLPWILDCISHRWHCRFTKIGDDYVVWYNDWAQKRRADISEPFVARWRKRFKQQKSPMATFDNRIEIAGQLTWRQLHLTLPYLLPEAGDWPYERDIRILQLLAALPEQTRRAAFSGETVSLLGVSLSLELSAGLRRTFPDAKEILPEGGAQMNARLRLRTGGASPEGFLLDNRWEVRVLSGDNENDEKLVAHSVIDARPIGQRQVDIWRKEEEGMAVSQAKRP